MCRQAAEVAKRKLPIIPETSSEQSPPSVVPIPPSRPPSIPFVGRYCLQVRGSLRSFQHYRWDIRMTEYDGLRPRTACRSIKEHLVEVFVAKCIT